MTLSFDLQGHPRSKVTLQMNSKYMTSYKSAIVTMGLWITVYGIQNNDLEFWSSRSSKVKGHIINEFRIHDFLLVCNSNYESKNLGLWDTDRWPWVLTFKVIKGHITNEFKIHDFLLVWNSNYGSMNHRLWDTHQRPWVLTFKVIQGQRSYYKWIKNTWLPISLQ